MSKTEGFRDDFVWGGATASYQVEGAAYEDGKGLNIWDVFCGEGGHIYDNHTGDVSCDQYHCYKEDVALMKKLGLKAYRFSINWARIYPEGLGKINEAGIDYYNRLIDELLANGIEPYVTLYHWDLPYALHKKGGFLNPEIADWFYEYASLAAERFSDRVKYFFTFNEPQCIIGLGYGRGEHAPGLKVDKKDFFSCYYNLLRAHGKMVQALREKGKQPLQIGLASCGKTYIPATESSEDIEAARRATFHSSKEALEKKDYEAVNWNIALLMDPIFKGKYPEDIAKAFEGYMTPLSDEDIRLVTQPLDFHAQNIYESDVVRAGKDGEPEPVKFPEGYAKTATGWNVTPLSLYYPPKFLYERYGKPVYISENGMAGLDPVSLDGKVHDTDRMNYMHRYLRELKRAVKDGVDIRGYFAWSVLDNFEWSCGYEKRFGLIYVNYETLERTPKDSFAFYQKIIETNGAGL